MSQTTTASVLSEEVHIHKDYVGAKIGMWMFLFTELLLFTGMFLLYAVYRTVHPKEFHQGSQELNVFFGTINTIILLTSSWTVAMSISAIQKGKKKTTLWLLGVTIVFGIWFMVNKYFEWSAKFHHGLYPTKLNLGEGFPESVLSQLPYGEQIFFGLYYVMTGLHGLHVLIGVLALAWVWWLVYKDRVNQEDFVILENGGLYWHLVDLIWIYLFPLFYLIS